MPIPSHPHTPSGAHRSRGGGGDSGKGAAPKTAALFVRIPAEHAQRLDRAAFALRVHKQQLVSELVDRYVDPDSSASLFALAKGWGKTAAAGGERRPTRQPITVETPGQRELTLGHHSFRPRDAEVLTPEEAAELLQVDAEVVLELARAHELPGRELRGEWRFARAALLAWLGAGAAVGIADGKAKGTAAVDAKG